VLECETIECFSICCIKCDFWSWFEEN